VPAGFPCLTYPLSVTSRKEAQIKGEAMTEAANMQDEYLTQLLKDKAAVTVFLVNGIRLEGTIQGFDRFSVLLHGRAVLQLIYKHAISAVVPSAGAPPATGRPVASGK
jgi:host factor-I protein